MSTTLEPLVSANLCTRHDSLHDVIRYMVPALIEECADCVVSHS